MSDIRIVANGILRRNQLTQLWQRSAHLWAKYNSAEPCRFLRADDIQELINPDLCESLRRYPYLRLWMVTTQSYSLLLQQRHKRVRSGMPRIAARDEHRIDARQAPKHLAPLLQRIVHGCRVRVV